MTINATNWAIPSKTSTNWTKTSANATDFKTRTYLSMADDTVLLSNDIYILRGYDPSIITKWNTEANWS